MSARPGLPFSFLSPAPGWLSMITTQIAWNVAHGLSWAAARNPDRAAIREGARTLTYRALNERVNRLAHALLGLGIRRGERLLVLLGDRSEHLEALFACAKAGIVAAPVDHRWRPDRRACGGTWSVP